jgi:fructosamine-3-kinase
MIPDDIKHQIGFFFSGNSKAIEQIHPVSGGSINNAVRFIAHQKKYFLKWNNATHYPGMFESEAKGLRLLRKSNTLFIPEILHSGMAGEYSFLLMEFLESGRPGNNFWETFGIQVARMHRNTNTEFGLDHDNYIGSLKQSNKQHKSWNQFFLAERIEPQLKLVVDNNILLEDAIKRMDKIANIIEGIFPLEEPSLLHGDLWRGNFMIAHHGQPCLIDPAVYYGHREMDLSMTKLFGGFDPEFYEAYYSEFPLESGFEKRIDLYNLYPLLVHVNLFGGSYLQQVKNILSRF